MTEGIITVKRFKFEKINHYNEMDRSEPFAYTQIHDDENSYRGYDINSKTGIMNELIMGLMPSLNPSIDKQVKNIINASNVEFLSGYIINPFHGDAFPDGTKYPDKQSLFGYDERSLVMTVLDTVLMRARFDELHNVNSYGNHPSLNYSKINEPLENIIMDRILFTKKEE